MHIYLEMLSKSIYVYIFRNVISSVFNILSSLSDGFYSWYVFLP